MMTWLEKFHLQKLAVRNGVDIQEIDGLQSAGVGYWENKRHLLSLIPKTLEALAHGWNEQTITALMKQQPQLPKPISSPIHARKTIYGPEDKVTVSNVRFA